MNLICPMCHVPMTAEAPAAGAKVACPTCRHLFSVGPASPAPPPVEPQRAPCPFCGHRVAPGALKCPNCKGTIGAIDCPACRERVPADAIACPHCQSQIRPGASAPAKPLPQRKCPQCARLYPQNVGTCEACRVPLGPAPQSKILCALLAIFVPFGIHRFLMGYTTIGVIQIVVVIFTCGIGALWPFIEGFLVLAGSLKMADGQDLTD